MNLHIHLFKSLCLSLVLCCCLNPDAFSQNALSFDGIDDRVDCGNHSSLQLSGTSITIEAWIKVDSWATNVWGGNIVNKEIWTPQYGYMLRCGAGGQLNFNLGSGPSWHELTSSTTVLSLNTWHHVAGTYDGSYMKLYVDGVAVDSVARSISFQDATGTNLTIGDYAGAGRNFHGTIDEVRIWNIARSRSDIVQNKDIELCGSLPPGLVAYYNFNQGVAGGSNTGITNLTDEIGNNDGTLGNFSLSSSTSNWVTGAPLPPSGSSRSMKDTICSGVNYSFGSQVLTSSGIYQETFPDSQGCDSVVDLDLHVIPVDTRINQVNFTLTARAQGVVYQWMDCSDSSIIAGETFRSFLPPVSGDYAVIITENGCTDTSDCYSVTGIGLDDKTSLAVEAYPVPFESYLTIDWKKVYSIVEITITDLSGKEVLYLQSKRKSQENITVEDLPSGIYFLKLSFEGKEQVLKIAK